MAPKKKGNPEPEPEKKLSRGDVDELIDDGVALLEERDVEVLPGAVEVHHDRLLGPQGLPGPRLERRAARGKARGHNATTGRGARPPARRSCARAGVLLWRACGAPFPFTFERRFWTPNFSKILKIYIRRIDLIYVRL